MPRASFAAEDNTTAGMCASNLRRITSIASTLPAPSLGLPPINMTCGNWPWAFTIAIAPRPGGVASAAIVANGPRLERVETPMPQLRRHRAQRRRIVVEKEHGFSDQQARAATASLPGILGPHALRIAERQIDAKDRPAAKARSHADMGVQDAAQALDDREPEAHAGRVLFAQVESMKFFENVGKLVARDPGSRIPDLNAQYAAARAATNQDAAALGIAQRVTQEISQDPFDQMQVRAHHGAARNDAKTKMALFGSPSVFVGETLEQRIDRNVRDFGNEGSGIDAGHLEQRCEQAFRGFERLIDAFEHRSTLGLEAPFAKCVDEQTRGTERLQEIVAGGGQKFGLAQIRALGLNLQLLERLFDAAAFLDLFL